MILFTNAPMSMMVEQRILDALGTIEDLRFRTEPPRLRPVDTNTYEVTIEVKQVEPKL